MHSCFFEIKESINRHIGDWPSSGVGGIRMLCNLCIQMCAPVEFIVYICEDVEAEEHKNKQLLFQSTYAFKTH